MGEGLVSLNIEVAALAFAQPMVSGMAESQHAGRAFDVLAENSAISSQAGSDALHDFSGGVKPRWKMRA